MPVKKISIKISPRSRFLRSQDWQQNVIRQIKKSWGDEKIINRFQLQALIIIFFVRNKRSDIDNLAGNIFNCLSRSILRDDRLNFIPRLYTDHFLVSPNRTRLRRWSHLRTEKIEIVLIYNQKHWRQIFLKEIGEYLFLARIKNIF